jgi:hypothetical protein
MGQSNAARDKLYDLRQCQLSGADARGLDLSGVIMSKTDVSNAKFAESYFSKGYLRGASRDSMTYLVLWQPVWISRTSLTLDWMFDRYPARRQQL